MTDPGIAGIPDAIDPAWISRQTDLLAEPEGNA
jgi:hypothetical protein